MINNWTGVGRLTKDCELRFLADGKGVASFTLAVQRPFKNKQGDYDADFVNIVTFRNAEVVADALRKGSLAGVVGRIQTRSYDNSQGQKVFVTEVMAETVQFLEPKNSNKGQGQQQNSSQNKDDDPFAGNNSSYSGDDLPFN